MPAVKVLPTTPAWLADGSAVQSLFINSKAANKAKSASVGPKRTVTLRDTQGFVAVGKKIRCAELKQLKRESERGSEVDYKELDLPGMDFDIHQLEMSADCNVLAVIGDSRLGVCLLPSVDDIKATGTNLKIPTQFFEVGKSDLATSGGKIVKVLWHPMGAALCLVVVTDDSIVRMYELEINMEGSANKADQTLDLNMMVSGGQTGFSIFDEIIPTSACFGSSQDVWSPFTLYILTRGGDVYAMCPLVPSRWVAAPDYMEELGYELHTLNNPSEDDEAPSTPLSRYNTRQAIMWMEDAFRLQKVMKMESPKKRSGPVSQSDVLLRPEHQDLNTPYLQGPFLLQPAPKEKCLNEDVYASDIVHISAESFNTIAVLYSNGEIDSLVEFDTITPRWEVKTLKNKKYNISTPYPILSCFETIDLKLRLSSEANVEHWPTFSPDKAWAGRLLVNHSHGVSVVCMEDWIAGFTKLINEEDEPVQLQKELNRIPGSWIQQVIAPLKNAHGGANAVLGSAILLDAYLGYVVLSQRRSVPGFALLDIPSRFRDMLEAQMEEEEEEAVIVTSTPEKPLLAITAAPPVSVIELGPLKSQVYKNQINKLRSAQGRLWKSDAMISEQHKRALEDLRTIFTVEIGIRQKKAEEIANRAVVQRNKFLDQLELFSKAAEDAKKVQKEKEDQLEKLKMAQERQAEIKTRSLALLSKLAVTSRRAGYAGYSDAEGKWFAELQAMKQFEKTAKKKQSEMQRFVEDMVVEEDRKPTPNQDLNESFTRSLRMEKTGDLSALVSKEQTMIDKLGKKLGSLELSYQTLE